MSSAAAATQCTTSVGLRSEALSSYPASTCHLKRASPTPPTSAAHPVVPTTYCCSTRRPTYHASLSDAAGLDPKIHYGEADGAIGAVRSFLAAKSQRTDLPEATFVARRHALFFAKLPLLARIRKLRLKEVRSWDYVNDVQAIMAEWIVQNPP
jgi:hypothetical protein